MKLITFNLCFYITVSRETAKHLTVNHAAGYHPIGTLIYTRYTLNAVAPRRYPYISTLLSDIFKSIPIERKCAKNTRFDCQFERVQTEKNMKTL